jgi:CRP/FNR family transcriptional regulator, nitrogen fixation regulation protein
MLTHSAVHVDAVRHPAVSGRHIQNRLHEVTESAGSLDQQMRLMGATMSYPRNAEIFGENEPADYLYKVIGGSVRTYKILSDGRRQIGGFYLPGDIFGLDFGDKHVLAAEAVANAKVLVVKRSALNALAGRDASIAAQLFALIGRELSRAQDHIVLLIQNAQERVAGFLLEMAERSPLGTAIELPMSRQDIADYLGLTIETVSRTLTSMDDAATIELTTSRRIVLCNLNALRRMNG